MRSGGVSVLCEEAAQLEMNFEGWGAVGLCGGRQIGAKEADCELRRVVGLGEGACCIDQRRTVAPVGGYGGSEGVEHLVGLIFTPVEVAEVDVGFGCFPCIDGSEVLGFSGGGVFFLFGDQGKETV